MEENVTTSSSESSDSSVEIKKKVGFSSRDLFTASIEDTPIFVVKTKEGSKKQ